MISKIFFLKLLLLFWLSFFTKTIFAENINNDDFEINNYFANLSSFEADFIQTSTNPLNNSVHYFLGKIHLLKKSGLNLMRFDYLEPSKQLMIADGQYFWMVDYDLEQISRYQQSSLNLSIDQILNEANFEKLSQRTLQKKQENYYRLKKNKTDTNEIILVFSDNQLTKIISEDNLENLVIFELSNLKINQPLKANLFIIDNPDNFEVIEVK